MQRPTFDPGLTQQYGGELRRVINADGSFNVQRQGTSLSDTPPYLYLVSAPWPQFVLWVVAAYLVVNIVFAGLYFSLGPNALVHNAPNVSGPGRFAQCLFFSSQTLTTVGFGAIAPGSPGANIVAAFEALTGLLGFAVITGVFFGRVSRPSARIGFSERAIIAPYQDGTSLQFRIVNRREDNLIDPEATLMLMTVVRANGGHRREFTILPLERSRILFFPLTWTIVHPIDSQSPLYAKTAADLQELEAEFMVMIKAWDENFSQIVHQRFSYRHSEVVWGGRFSPAFGVNVAGTLEVHVNRISDYVAAPLPEANGEKRGTHPFREALNDET